MLVNITVSIMGILVFLFIFWKRLREDYSSEIIFKTAIFTLTGIGIGSAIANIFFPTWFFWSSFFGAAVGLAISIRFLKLKFYETFEAFVVSILPWIGFIFLKNSVQTSSLISFLGFVVILIIIFISYFFDTHYKKISWYKSGRLGFAGLATAFLFFLVRIVLAIFKVPVISFVGSFEWLLSLVFAVASLILLYERSKE